MMFPTILIAGLVLLQSVGTNAACECGYRVPGSGALYTNRIHNDFSQEPDTESPELAFWDIQTWNSTLSGDDEGEVVKENLISNVWIEDGQLHLLQQGWNGEGTVKVAEIHSKEIQMYHGHFVARYRVRQNDTAEGGAVSGFFFYLSDKMESDIEILTNDADPRRIHYTNQPSWIRENDTVVRGASYNETTQKPWWEFQEHGFEWTEEGTGFLQDGNPEPKRTITKNIPDKPGRIMINLWSNNGSWSGLPSSEDVIMDIEYITLLYNTSASDAGRDEEYNELCADPSETPICGPRDHYQPEEVQVQIGGGNGKPSCKGWLAFSFFLMAAGVIL